VTIIAKLRTLSVPDLYIFPVRGLLPIPPGFQFGTQPIKLVHPLTGYHMPTQVELVARHSGGGAAVVEVIGQCERGALVAGQPAEFPIELGEPPPLSASKAIPGSTVALVLPGGLELDMDGQLTPLSVMAGHALRWHRGKPLPGNLMATIELAGTIGQGGFHAWLTGWAGVEALDLDIVIHNGRVNAPKAWMDFSKLSLVVPIALGPWKASLVWPVPQAEGYVPWAGEGTASTMDLVPPNFDHSIPPRGEHHIRIRLRRYNAAGIAPPEQIEAWCVPVDGENLLCWQRQGSSYLGLGRPLPHDVGQPLGYNNYDGELDTLHSQLADGKALMGGSGLNVPSTVASGWHHTAGGTYGGQTGGVWIDQVPGVDVALSGDRAAIEVSRIYLRAVANRQRQALYESDGLPTDGLFALYQAESTQFAFDTNFIKDDPWGYTKVLKLANPTAHQAHVDSFAPLDGQHLIRATRNAKVLVWLDNDPIARRFLDMAAEWQLMIYGSGATDGLTFSDGSRLAQLVERAIQWPASGTPLGRGEAWGIDAICAAYATGSDKLRQRVLPVLKKWLDVLATSQTPIGAWQAESSGKTVQEIQAKLPTVAVSQAIEFGITAHAVRALMAALGVTYEPLVGDAATGLVEHLWPVGAGAPHQKFATAEGVVNAGLLGPPWAGLQPPLPDGATYSDYGGDAFQVLGLLALVATTPAGRLRVRWLLGLPETATDAEALAALRASKTYGPSLSAPLIRALEDATK
jgi:hypothetical protein